MIDEIKIEEIPEEDEEEKDVEVTEFSLIEEEIDELILKLKLLKETKESISFDIDDENTLAISYEENETDDEDFEDLEEDLEE